MRTSCLALEAGSAQCMMVGGVPPVHNRVMPQRWNDTNLVKYGGGSCTWWVGGRMVAVGSR